MQISTVSFASETYYMRVLFYLFIINNGFEWGTISLGGSKLSLLVRAVLRRNRMPPAQYCDLLCKSCHFIWINLKSLIHNNYCDTTNAITLLREMILETWWDSPWVVYRTPDFWIKEGQIIIFKFVISFSKISTS